MLVTPPPRYDEQFNGYPWKSWFESIYNLLNGVSHSGGHWYLFDGAAHAITTSVGIKASTTTVVNTTTPTLLYSYNIAANEVHTDEQVLLNLLGSIDAATGAETVTIAFKLAGATLRTLVVTPKNTTNSGWKAEYSITIRTSGTSGTLVDSASFKTDIASISSASTATTAIDTTIANLLEIYATWGAAKAGNSISCAQGGIVFHH